MSGNLFNPSGAPTAGPTIDQFGNPLPQGQQPFLSAGPNFWRDSQLAGANLANAVDARTSGGFLAHPSAASAINLGLGGGAMQGAGLDFQNAQRQDILSQIQQRQALLPSMQAQGMGAGMKAMLEAEMMRAQLPFMQQRMQMQNQIMTDPRFKQQFFGDMGGGSAASGPMGSQDSLVIPPEKREALVQQAVAGTPIPPAALDALVQTESGWDAHARNPKTGAFGLGQILPSTARAPGFGIAGVDSPTSLNDPLENLKFTAKYLTARGQALGLKDEDFQNNGYFSAVLGQYHGPTDAIGVGPEQYAQSVLNHMRGGPSWQVAQNANPNVQSDVQAMLRGQQQAQPGGYQPTQPSIAGQLPGFAMPGQALARADQLAAQARAAAMMGLDAGPSAQAAQELRQYALGVMKDQAAPSSLRGEFSARVNPLTGQTIQIPGRVPFYNQQTGGESTALVQPLGAGRGVGVPMDAPEGTVGIIPGKPGPGTERMLGEAAEDVTGKEARDKYEHALATRSSMAQLRAGLEGLNAGGSWSTTGPQAHLVQTFARNWNQFVQTLPGGEQLQFNPEKVAEGELVQKLTSITGMQVLNSMFGGSREAASVIKSTQGAVPSLANTPAGAKLVLNSMLEAANAEIDKHTFETNWANDPNRGGRNIGSDVAFNAQRPAELYGKRAISQVKPFAVTTPSDFSKYLPGTLVQLPSGRVAVVPGQTDVQPGAWATQQLQQAGQ